MKKDYSDDAREKLINCWMEEEREGKIFLRMHNDHEHLEKLFPKLEDNKEEYVEKYLEETISDMIDEHMDPYTYYGINRSDFG